MSEKPLFFYGGGKPPPYAPATRENFFPKISVRSTCLHCLPTGRQPQPAVNSFAVFHREATSRFPTTREILLWRFGKLQDEFTAP
jgi:hypothetical protein